MDNARLAASAQRAEDAHIERSCRAGDAPLNEVGFGQRYHLALVEQFTAAFSATSPRGEVWSRFAAHSEAPVHTHVVNNRANDALK